MNKSHHPPRTWYLKHTKGKRSDVQNDHPWLQIDAHKNSTYENRWSAASTLFMTKVDVAEKILVK